MRSWKTLLSDKRWLLLLGIIAFAILASWCESRMRSGKPPQPNTAQQNTGQAPGKGGERREPRPPPRQLPEEFEGTLLPVEQLKPDPAPTAPVALRQIRTRQQNDSDRIIFDFEGDAPPGFRVEYVDKLTRKCGSDELKVMGGTWLLVRLTPARARNESGRTTVGGVEFDEDLQVVKYLRQVCESDGQLEWLIEMTERKPYRAESLTEPARLVIDIKH
jgi:hypothetical protein